MATFLTDKIRLSNESSTTLEPEDYLSSSLGVIFPDDITNQHGDASTSVLYTSLSGPITLSLADPLPGSVSLFSHFVWNAAVQLASFLEESPLTWPVANEVCIELGAGTGLAGIIAAQCLAKKVVITDYPAPEILANLRTNVSTNIRGKAEVEVKGHEWGVLDGAFERENEGRFSRVLVADCLWMPHQHGNLLRSIRWFLAAGGRAWVIAGFHTGREKMRGFYGKDALEMAGLEVERIWERNADGGEREWVEDRGREDVTERKRWLVVGILKRVGD